MGSSRLGASSSIGDGYRSPGEFVSAAPGPSLGTGEAVGVAGGGAEDAGDPAGAAFGMTGAEGQAGADPARSRSTPEG